MIDRLVFAGVAYTSECTACEPGTYSVAGAADCEQCPRDTFSYQQADSCTECDNETEYAGLSNLLHLSVCFHLSVGLY